MRNYVDVLLTLDNVVVNHPLLIVEKLAVLLVINTEILRPHGSTLALEEAAALRL